MHLDSSAGFRCAREAGIAALRDAGSRKNVERGILVDLESPSALRMISSGWALMKKGGYGSVFGIPIEGRDAARNEIIKLKAAGAGIIKVMASGIVSLTKKETITPGGFNADELGILVQEAANVGLPVMAHANGEQAIIAAARAGVRSIEHGFFMTARALDELAKQNVFWTPTVGALARAAVRSDVSKEMQGYVSELIGAHLAMIKAAHAIGVSLAIGTDCVLPDADYQKAYQAELAYFERAGLSASAVRTIACDNGARLLGPSLK